MGVASYVVEVILADGPAGIKRVWESGLGFRVSGLVGERGSGVGIEKGRTWRMGGWWKARSAEAGGVAGRKRAPCVGHQLPGGNAGDDAV
jgi:hypothetical protein